MAEQRDLTPCNPSNTNNLPMAEQDPKPAETVTVTIPEENTPKEPEIPPSPKPKIQLPKRLTEAKTFAALLSITSFILSLPILGAVIWLLYMGDFDCESLLGLPKIRIVIIIGLIAVFIVSNLVVFVRIKYPVPGCLVAMVMFLSMFMVGIGLVGGSQTQGRSMAASPLWFLKTVNRISNWNNIKHCIYDTRVCDDLITRSIIEKYSTFPSTKLTYIESGCCKPPQVCDMQFVNATFWEKTTVRSTDLQLHSSPYYSDCGTWGNSSTTLCFNCQSCKDAFVKTLESKWKRLGVFLITMSVLLFLSHLIMFLFTMWDRYGR